MTTGKKVARRKLSLLELATELGNVSKACKIITSVRLFETNTFTSSVYDKNETALRAAINCIA